MTRTIIAFDPGGETGWATFSQDTMSINNEPRWTCGVLGPEEHHERLDQLLGLQHVSEYTVVYESFEFRNKHRDNIELISREYIGVIKRYYQANHSFGRVQLVHQTAAQGKVVNRNNSGFVTPENLKKLGFWVPGHTHDMDAYGHLLYYIIHKSNMRELATDLLRKGWK